MKEFWDKNGWRMVQTIITIMVIIIGFAATWGSIGSEVANNVADIKELQVQRLVDAAEFAKINGSLDHIIYLIEHIQNDPTD